MLKSGFTIFSIFVILTAVNKSVADNAIPWPYLAFVAIPISWFFLCFIRSKTQFSYSRVPPLNDTNILYIVIVFAPIIIGAIALTTGLQEIWRQMQVSPGTKIDGGYVIAVGGLFFGVGPTLFHLFPHPKLAAPQGEQMTVDYTPKK